MDNMNRFIALIFLTLVAFFLGLAPLKAQKSTIKPFYSQHVGNWEIRGTLNTETNFKICAIITRIGDSRVFSYQVGIDDNEIGVVLAFRNSRWKLKPSPDQGGHDLIGTMTFKSLDGQVSGTEIDYTTLDDIAFVELKEPIMFFEAVKKTSSISFAPEDGRMAVIVEFDEDFTRSIGPLRECMTAAKQLEYFKK